MADQNRSWAHDARLVFAHELADVVRSRSTILRLVAQPLALLIPAVLVLATITSVRSELRRTTYVAAVSGPAEDVAALSDALDAAEIELRRSPKPVLAVAREEADIGLRVDPGTASRLAEGEATAVAVYVQPARERSRRGAAVAGAALARLGAETAAESIAERGLAPSVLVPYSVRTDDVAPPDLGAARVALADALPLVLGIGLLGVSSLALERVGGRRAARGVEPLAVLPLARSAITGGIAAVAALVGLGAGALTIVPLSAAAIIVVGQDPAGGAGPLVVAGVVLLGIAGLAITFAALGTWLATATARSGTARTLGSGIEVLAVTAFLVIPLIPEELGRRLLVLPLVGPPMLAHLALDGGVGIVDVVRAALGTAVGASLLLKAAGRQLQGDVVLRESGA